METSRVHVFVSTNRQRLSFAIGYEYINKFIN